MKKVFTSVSPGFYKTKLFNELSKKEDIFVIYTSDYDKSSRNSDFLSGERNYEHIVLSGSLLRRITSLISLLCKTQFDELIIGGYDTLMCWIPLFVTKKKKCSLIIESTYRETVGTGFRAFFKRVFLSRITRVYAPGTPHARLVREFGFKKEIRIWKSVGLFNTVPQPPYEERVTVKHFLFVGRLIPVKNLAWLINRFSGHKELELTIVGFGEQGEYLKSLVHTDNIHFIGAVNNKDLPLYYQSADVFILPSLTETWGLVVEEALNNGCPIMCSNMVGSADDLVVKLGNGVVFNVNDDDNFEEKLESICNIDHYNQIRKSISYMDFEKYEESVVNAFVN